MFDLRTNTAKGAIGRSIVFAGLIAVLLVPIMMVPSFASDVSELAGEASSESDEASGSDADKIIVFDDTVESAEVADDEEGVSTTEDDQDTSGDSAPTSDGDADASGEEVGENAVSEDSVEGTGFIGTSWRYLNGEPRDTAANGGISLFSVTSRAKDARISWTKKSDGTYAGSNGVIVKGADSIGIDVSQWNGAIDWKAVKNAGIDFAIIRCGYGSSGTDPYFIENVRGCQENDIPFGIYLYCYAWDYESGLREAKHTLDLLKKAGLDPADIELPVFFDLENEASGGKNAGKPCGIDQAGKEVLVEKDGFAEMATAFCDTLGSAGYTPGIYANLNWFTNYLTDDCFDSWPRWVAQYSGDGDCDYKGDYLYWQCMATGKVDGISGNVDINFSYISSSRDWAAPKLKFVTPSANGIKVSWSSVPWASGYAVYRKPSGGSWKMVDTTTSTSYVDKTALSSGGTYYYTVRAYHYTVRAYRGSESAAKAGRYSARYWGYFDAEGVEAVCLPTPELSGVEAASGGRKVSWRAARGASGYAVYRKAAGGSWSMIATTSSTSYVDKASLLPLHGARLPRLRVRRQGGQVLRPVLGLLRRRGRQHSYSVLARRFVVRMYEVTADWFQWGALEVDALEARGNSLGDLCAEGGVSCHLSLGRSSPSDRLSQQTVR